MFVNNQRSGTVRSRRGDINSDTLRTPRQIPRRVILDDAGRVVQDGSDAASFANINPATSEADALGGSSSGLIWGTTISIDDSFVAFKDFLRNFTYKYRMWADGSTEADTDGSLVAESKVYWEMMENMLLLGTNKLYLDLRDLKAYPRTLKLWHQVQAYPSEIIPVMDQCVHDSMIELARIEMASQRETQSTVSASHAPQSSEPAFPSSDRGEEPATPLPSQSRQPTLEDQVATMEFVVRPWAIDKVTNLRDLNPSGMSSTLFFLLRDRF